ncbi:MAG TPA: ATP-binding protein [Synergistaceae bacterium]|nr:ATP-binding protein [Synergistaceae bacterium]
MKHPGFEQAIRLILALPSLCVILAVVALAFQRDYARETRLAFETLENIKNPVQNASNVPEAREFFEKSAAAAYWTVQREKNDIFTSFSLKNGEDFILRLHTKALFLKTLENQKNVIMTGMIGFVIALEIGMFFSYGFTRPIKRLIWGCRQISRGNWVTIPHSWNNTREFTEMEKAFNRMSRELSQWHQIQEQLYRVEHLAGLGKIVAGVAHEIRNPLTSIKLYTGLLEKHVSPEGKPYFFVIKEESERLNDTVKRYLSLANPRAPLFADFSLKELFHWCSTVIEPHLQEKEIRLSLELSPENFSWKGDFSLYQQMMLNLVMNSLEAMENKENGILEIQGLLEEETLHIRVRDNGSGIPRENLSQVMMPFFTTKETGTGLGLSLVYSVVEAHSGNISLDSSPAGTAITLKFPRI